MAASRIVHQFDFLEPDNLEPVPKYWVRFPDADYPDPEFPRYTEAFFDGQVGHEAPPSFYLRSVGRSVAYRYMGIDTRVRPGDYLVAGWIRPDRMEHSRAALSAYYLDWEGNYIASTQRFSKLVEPTEGGDDWQEAQVRLPSAPRRAHAIGVTCWVVQQDVWREGIMPHRHISMRDVGGGAWFDDIVVVGLPRVVLESRHPGGVVEYPDAPVLVATVADEDPEGLRARLEVRNQNGVRIFSAQVRAHQFENAQPIEIPVPVDRAGLYHAELAVSSLGKPILSRTLTFAVLGEAQGPRAVPARSMGVILSDVAPDQTDEQMVLVRILKVGSAKVPLWTGQPARPGYDSFRPALHRVLDQMIESQVSAIGTFSGPPVRMVRTVGLHARSLLDILSESPEGWQDELDSIVAPYANVFRSWQIGGDGDLIHMEDGRTAPALAAVGEVMRHMIAHPNLTTVASAAREPPDVREAQNVSVELPTDIGPGYVGAHLRPYLELDYDNVWVSVPRAGSNGYDAERVLADWALRICEARWAGADGVFVDQPWRTRRSLGQTVTEPELAYLVYRTVVDTIGDLRPAFRPSMGGTAQALIFVDETQATVILWDPAAPPEGSPTTLQLGTGAVAVDIWGRPVALSQSDDGRQQVTLTPAPIFVTGVERWLVAFRAGMKLTPSRVDFSFESQKHTLTISNPRDKAISAEITLSAPESWDLQPRRLRFSLNAGQSREYAVDIRHPPNETAGTKTIGALVRLLSGGDEVFNVPLEFDLGLSDVDVIGYAVTEGDQLVVRHGVTNRADVPLSFRAFAIFPGRSRQYRVINELLPGQTLTTMYRFADVGKASGKQIRLGLREVNGPRIHNMQVIAP